MFYVCVFYDDSLHVDRKRKEGLVVVFLLCSSPTVDVENRVKRLQPNVNSPNSVSGSGFWFRFNWIYKMPSKTRQKVYFATIRDLEHQRTPLTTRWGAHFWIDFLPQHTFRVVLKTGLWMPIDSHSKAGRGDFEMSQIPKAGPIVKIQPKSTTLFHPRQTRKGCSKFINL